MKNLKIMVLLVPAILLSQIIFGQGYYSASPSNFTQVADQIFQDYPQRVQIGIGQLETHLEYVVHPNTNDPSCKEPFLQFAAATPNSISLEWSSIPGASSYEVAYINLETGVTSTWLLTGLDHTFTGLTDGLHAFSLVSFCSDGTVRSDFSSNARIIIIDKPVLFREGNNENCYCSQPVVEAAANPVPNGLKLDWTPLANEKYLFKINYGTGPSSSMLLFPQYSGYVSPRLIFTADCYNNMHDDNNIRDNNFYAPGTSKDIKIYMQGDPYTFDITGRLFNITSVTISRCYSAKSRYTTASEDENESVLFPNPARDLVQINYKSKELKNVPMQIFNSYGQEIFAEDVLTNARFELSTEDWAPGLYHLVIANGTERKTYPFLKVR